MPGSLICYLNKVCPKILKLMKGKLSKMHVHVSSSTHYHFSLGKNHKNKNQFLTEIYNGKCLPGISFLRFEVTWNTLHNFSLLSSEYIYLCAKEIPVAFLFEALYWNLTSYMYRMCFKGEILGNFSCYWMHIVRTQMYL